MADYQRLSSDSDRSLEKGEFDSDVPESRICPAWLSRGMIFLFFIVFVQLVVDIRFVTSSWKSEASVCSPRNPHSPPLLYSPAQDVIDYEFKVFTRAFEEDKTPYQALPSDEVDALWSDLYNFGISQIPKSQAALIPNQTSPIPGNEDHFIVELQLFHELHCLNFLRQSLWPEYYFPKIMMMGHGLETVDEIREHNLHCIDALRQSIMCTADISPLVWQWQEKKMSTVPRFGIPHVCRKFEPIQEWAKAHELQGTFDGSVHLESEFVIPVIH